MSRQGSVVRSPRGSPDANRMAASATPRRLEPDHASALEENVQAIKRWEQAILRARSKAEQISVPSRSVPHDVSLEAIFLALFVLTSQNRPGRQADKRGPLDLQIDLLASAR